MENKKTYAPQKQTDEENPIYAHKYAIHFDILPEISYLNQELPILIAELLQIFNEFPKNIQISQKSVDEGIDFCRVIFWVLSESSDALKTFSIWFQALFRDTHITHTLEKIITCALDGPNALQVELTDWTRVHTLESEVHHVVQTDSSKKIR